MLEQEFSPWTWCDIPVTTLMMDLSIVVPSNTPCRTTWCPPEKVASLSRNSSESCTNQSTCTKEAPRRPPLGMECPANMRSQLRLFETRQTHIVDLPATTKARTSHACDIWLHLRQNNQPEMVHETATWPPPGWLWEYCVSNSVGGKSWLHIL